MAAIISGAIHNLKEGWEDQQRMEATESQTRMSEVCSLVYVLLAYSIKPREALRLKSRPHHITL